MADTFHILAQRLARDHLWPVLVFLAALAVLAGFRALGHRVAEHRKTTRRLHDMNGQRHEPVSHGHAELHKPPRCLASSPAVSAGASLFRPTVIIAHLGPSRLYRFAYVPYIQRPTQ